MAKLVFDPEETRWMRRAHGTLLPRKGNQLHFSMATPFRLTGFEVEKGEGLVITDVSIGPHRQLVPKMLLPLHTMDGLICQLCLVGNFVLVRFFNRTSVSIEYDFRAVGLELE